MFVAWLKKQPLGGIDLMYCFALRSQSLCRLQATPHSLWQSRVTMQLGVLYPKSSVAKLRGLWHPKIGFSSFSSSFFKVIHQHCWFYPVDLDGVLPPRLHWCRCSWQALRRPGCFGSTGPRGSDDSTWKTGWDRWDGEVGQIMLEKYFRPNLSSSRAWTALDPQTQICSSQVDSAGGDRILKRAACADCYFARLRRGCQEFQL